MRRQTKKKLKIIVDVEFEQHLFIDEDSLDFNICQKGEDIVDQQGLIIILDGIKNYKKKGHTLKF